MHLQKLLALMLIASSSCWKLKPRNPCITNIQATGEILQVTLDVSESYSFQGSVPVLDHQQEIKLKIAPIFSYSSPPHDNEFWNLHRFCVHFWSPWTNYSFCYPTVISSGILSGSGIFLSSTAMLWRQRLDKSSKVIFEFFLEAKHGQS